MPRSTYVSPLVTKALAKLEAEIQAAESRAELFQLKKNYERVWLEKHSRMANERWHELGGE